MRCCCGSGGGEGCTCAITTTDPSGPLTVRNNGGGSFTLGLDASKLPAGPKGDPGPRGDRGPQGNAGPAGKDGKFTADNVDPTGLIYDPVNNRVKLDCDYVRTNCSAGGGGSVKSITGTAPVNAVNDGAGNYTINVDCLALTRDCVKPHLDQLVAPCAGDGIVHVRAQADLVDGVGTIRVGTVGPTDPAQVSLTVRVQGQTQWTALLSSGALVNVQTLTPPCTGRTVTVEVRDTSRGEPVVTGDVVLTDTCESSRETIIDFPLPCEATNALKIGNDGLYVEPGANINITGRNGVKATRTDDGYTVEANCPQLIDNCIKPNLQRLVSDCSVKVHISGFASGDFAEITASLHPDDASSGVSIQARVQGEPDWKTLHGTDTVVLKDDSECKTTVAVEVQAEGNPASLVTGNVTIDSFCRGSLDTITVNPCPTPNVLTVFDDGLYVPNPGPPTTLTAVDGQGVTVAQDDDGTWRVGFDACDTTAKKTIAACLTDPCAGEGYTVRVEFQANINPDGGARVLAGVDNWDELPDPRAVTVQARFGEGEWLNIPEKAGTVTVNAQAACDASHPVSARILENPTQIVNGTLPIDNLCETSQPYVLPGLTWCRPNALKAGDNGLYVAPAELDCDAVRACITRENDRIGLDARGNLIVKPHCIASWKRSATGHITVKAHEENPGAIEVVSPSKNARPPSTPIADVIIQPGQTGDQNWHSADTGGTILIRPKTTNGNPDWPGPTCYVGAYGTNDPDFVECCEYSPQQAPVMPRVFTFPRDTETPPIFPATFDTWTKDTTWPDMTVELTAPGTAVAVTLYARTATATTSQDDTLFLSWADEASPDAPFGSSTVRNTRTLMVGGSGTQANTTTFTFWDCKPGVYHLRVDTSYHDSDEAEGEPRRVFGDTGNPTLKTVQDALLQVVVTPPD
ncbi:collagen-like triple helix repeat-containing protein [Streptomyces noursei]